MRAVYNDASTTTTTIESSVESRRCEWKEFGSKADFNCCTKARRWTVDVEESGSRAARYA
jgi:hypothetical protein